MNTLLPRLIMGAIGLGLGLACSEPKTVGGSLLVVLAESPFIREDKPPRQSPEQEVEGRIGIVHGYVCAGVMRNDFATAEDLQEALEHRIAVQSHFLHYLEEKVKIVEYTAGEQLSLPDFVCANRFHRKLVEIIVVIDDSRPTPKPVFYVVSSYSLRSSCPQPPILRLYEPHFRLAW
jgi:hypothetical protein